MGKHKHTINLHFNSYVATFQRVIHGEHLQMMFAGMLVEELFDNMIDKAMSRVQYWIYSFPSHCWVYCM